MVMLWAQVLGREGSRGPSPAEAAAVAGPQAGGGVQIAGGGRQAAGGGPWGAEAGGMLQEWLASPVRPLERNLFAVRLDYFPSTGSGLAAADESIEGFWEQLAKSSALQADQRRERQILVENLRRQASQLRLQTIVMGEMPKAMINGEPVGVGDVVALFRVDRIEARRVVVEREGIRFELPMN
jgi:hypothetical protein